MAYRSIPNWERLVSSALRREQLRASGGSGRQGDDLAGFVPPSLGSNIDAILQAANEIQADDPNVARILCEHAYSLAQNLDPNSEGRGVLQFKTGLMSVIKQKMAKKEGERIDRSLDITRIQEFYKYYREKHNIDGFEEQERKRMESGGYDVNPYELERRTIKMRKVYATLRVLKDVIAALTQEASPEQADELISEELKKVMESDAAKTGEFRAYNILPLEGAAVSDVIISLPEVRAAVKALEYFELPPMSPEFVLPQRRPPDIFDLLQNVFGFQMDNTKNQREHLVLLLANAQSYLRVLQESDPQLDEDAINKVCDKILDNYIKWCHYLRKTSIYRQANTKKKKLLLVSLYLLIWGEGANVRFLPECLCYIFHQMAEELMTILLDPVVREAKSCKEENGSSFLNKIISPVYDALAVEAGKNSSGKAPHSAWRNYDDFNEYFWSQSCFELQWPWRLDAAFFSKKTKMEEDKKIKQSRKAAGMGKTSFVEHRTYLHLYHSFHRLWIFLIMMFQGLTIIGFSKKIDVNTLKDLLSLGPTFVIMKFIQSVLDIILMFGAYTSSQGRAIARIFLRFLWFGCCSGLLTYLLIKVLQERKHSGSQYFQIYLWVLGVYVAYQLCVTLLLRIPLLRIQADKFDRWEVVQFLKWMHQEHYYVGRGLYERTGDYLRYILFWLIIFGCKFTFSYFLQIKPLVSPTRTIVKTTGITYTWHDLVSKHNHNALTIASFWAPVGMIYFLDISIWYTVLSAIVGGLIGARERLGEIRSLEMLQNRFESFPEAFVDKLQHPRTKIVRTIVNQEQVLSEKPRGTAARFAPFWNEIIKCLREEDYINNREKELLFMPPNKGDLPLVQWPLFLLVGKVFLAIELAGAHKESQDELWEKVRRDKYMCHAVEEAYRSVAKLLLGIVNSEAKTWVGTVLGQVDDSILEKSFLVHFQTKKLSFVLSRVTALTGLLVYDETPERAEGAVKAIQDLYEVVTHDVLSAELREQYLVSEQLAQARSEGRLFAKLKWPSIQERDEVKRLHLLLTIKESAANVPKNLEARRRLQFFTNSLFMNMPKSTLVREMISFSVFTPYYSEDVMYSKDQLKKENEDGISTLFYLQKIFPDEWRNFLERMGLTEATLETQLTSSSRELLELRLWASYRGQTLARTVRGMMYYRRALMLQSFLEHAESGDVEEGLEEIGSTNVDDFGVFRGSRAQADLKFTYVVTCQIYGQQKQKHDPRAADILYLLQKNEALRVAFIDTVESLKDGKVHKEFYSKLVKADINGKDQEIYKIKLPGDPKLGEGKPENQNHAIVFTRGDAIQTIDMNQDNYFEEALKMRNLLAEFQCDHGLRPASILGVREHVFTGSVSSLAWFMSNQETSFVTLGQRVLANPLKVRMHYGHPDVFDRLFHITRGGISKASRVINISEDIYAGFNSTLRQGNITHHEYIQVGKGRDVGLNQIALFEAKVASGNGEQSLSRDVYRLGHLFDFIRMLSFYITSVGYYVCTMMTALTVYVFLYGKAYLALSGVGAALENRAEITNNTALQSALDTQFLFQIGVFTAIPMLMGFILEQGVLKAIISFVTMQLQLCSVFFTFSLGTRTHYFGRTILHGGAKYRATGRGFVVQHIKFADNYRLYSRSHFVKALEIALLLIVYLAYGYENTTVSYILLSFSSWFLAISWLFAPYIFNPSGFEWQKTVYDFDDWTNWLLYKGGVGVKGEESWEAWWDEEQEHIRSLRSRILETILSLRFFIFQYGVVYQLSAAGKSTSLLVYGISWLILAAIIFMFKVFTFSQKASVNFQMLLRLIQGTVFVLIITGLVVVVAVTRVTVGDLFASLLALIPTGWAILSIAIAWKPLVKRVGLWQSIRSIARFYDAAMGMVIFVPIAILSWFPFVSTFQTRLVFNQAFSRGLEISLILAGNRPNAQV